ncbi:MAG: hypothetical protein EOP04_03170 [Proteobacteria bacterium]|nr:MAG: hypothetical protein EOP04_03170 [Pseudomonadota bacterium]
MLLHIDDHRPCTIHRAWISRGEDFQTAIESLADAELIAEKYGFKLNEVFFEFLWDGAVDEIKALSLLKVSDDSGDWWQIFPAHANVFEGKGNRLRAFTQ